MKRICLILAVILLSVSCSKHHQLYNKKPAFYSYMFGSAKSSGFKFQYNSEVYVTPASCQKAMLALLAYQKLGADFQYQTTIYTAKSGGQFRDLIISFTGDPSLTSQDLLTLLEPVKNRQFNRIILDISAFQTSQYSPNILIRDIGTRYSTPVSAMSIDQNLFGLTIKPTRLDRKANISNEGGYKIINEILTTAEESFVRISWEGDNIVAKGNIKEATSPLELKIAPPDIKEYALRKMKEITKNAQIQGKVVIISDEEKLPKNPDLVNIFESQPLKVTLSDALSSSNNLVFDSLYLKLITMQNSQITEWYEGSDVIKSLMKEEFDIDFKDSVIVDGSGLSRYNKIQTKMLFDLLKKGYENKDFVLSLPSPGEVKSTLERRKTLPIDVRAKTGNMRGITCLCGYKINDRNPKVFIITAHDFVPPSLEMFSIVDKFVGDNL